MELLLTRIRVIPEKRVERDHPQAIGYDLGREVGASLEHVSEVGRDEVFPDTASVSALLT